MHLITCGFILFSNCSPVISMSGIVIYIHNTQPKICDLYVNYCYIYFLIYIYITHNPKSVGLHPPGSSLKIL